MQVVTCFLTKSVARLSPLDYLWMDQVSMLAAAQGFLDALTLGDGPLSPATHRTSVERKQRRAAEQRAARSTLETAQMERELEQVKGQIKRSSSSELVSSAQEAV